MMLESMFETVCAIEDQDDRDEAIHDLAYEMIVAGAMRMDIGEIEHRVGRCGRSA